MVVRSRERHRLTLLAPVVATLVLTLAACDTEGTPATTDAPTTVEPLVDAETAPATNEANLDALRERVALVEQRIEAASALVVDIQDQADGNVESLAVQAEAELDEARVVLTEVLTDFGDTVTPAPAATE